MKLLLIVAAAVGLIATVVASKAALGWTLNRLTLFGVIVGGLNIVVQLISIFAQHPK